MKGPTYIGKGNLESYSDVILNYERESAFIISSVEKSSEGMVITVDNRSSFLGTLLLARPKRIIWSFIQNDDSVAISTNIFLHYWYIIIFLISCAIWPPLLKFALDISRSKPLLSTLSFISSLGLLAFSYFLLMGESGRRIHSIFEALQIAAQTQNEVLTRTPHPRLSLHARHLLYYLAYACTMFWVVIVKDNTPFVQYLIKYKFAAFLLPPVGLLIASLLILPNRSVSLRLHSMLPGFEILLGILFLSVVFWLWKIPAETFGHVKFDVWTTASTALDDPSHALPSNHTDELNRNIKMLRQVVISSLFFWVAIICIGIGLIVDGVRLTQLALPGSSRLTRFSSKDKTIARAASGSGFLKIFRLFFGGAWLSLGTLILYGITMNGMAFISALVGPEQFIFLPTSQWVQVSQRLLALAVTGKLESNIIFSFVRMGWILGCGLSVLLVGVSIFQLVFQRRNQFRKLLQLTNKRHCYDKFVKDMASFFSMEPPLISIKNTKDINAWAHEFGLFRRQRFIEITSGAIAQERITPGFLRFVIGHELSHLKIGHVSWLNWLRWFGRLTLVGDTFVFTLFNSWGCEEAADLYVLHNTNIPPYIILGSLEILQSQAFIRSKSDNAISVYANDNLDGPIDSDSTGNYRWKIKNLIRVFTDQYTNPFSHSYWHPNITSRIESIKMKKKDATQIIP